MRNCASEIIIQACFLKFTRDNTTRKIDCHRECSSILCESPNLKCCMQRPAPSIYGCNNKHRCLPKLHFHFMNRSIEQSVPWWPSGTSTCNCRRRPPLCRVFIGTITGSEMNKFGAWGVWRRPPQSKPDPGPLSQARTGTSKYNRLYLNNANLWNDIHNSAKHISLWGTIADPPTSQTFIGNQ